MSSDADYASFLEKANQDTGAASASASSSSAKPSSGGGGGFANTKATDGSSSVPAVLKSVDAFYQSDTDEPFEPVALKFGNKSLGSEAFAKLIGYDGEVEEVKVDEWNVKNVYGDVVEAVKKAGGEKGEVKVFRVEHGSTRCEYYVVVVDADGAVVGVKARAVES